MSDKFGLLPFMLLTTTTIPGARVNINRIIEAIVIACIAAMATSYVTGKILETKMATIERVQQEDKAEAKQMRYELKNDVKELKDIVYDHILMKNNRSK